MKEPFEDSIENSLKKAGEAGSFCEFDKAPLDSIIPPDVHPIFCEKPKGLDYALLGKKALDQRKLIADHGVMQRDDQSRDEFIASLKSEYDDVVTLEDLRHENLKGSPDEGIISGYDWMHVLQQRELHGVLFDRNDSKAMNRSRWLGILVREFVLNQDAELLRTLVEAHDPDVTLSELAEAFLHFYDQSKDRIQRAGLSEAPFKGQGFYAGLELLASGIQNAKDLVASEGLSSGLDGEAIEDVCSAVLEMVAKTEGTRYEALQDFALKRHSDHRERFVWQSDGGNLGTSLSANAKAKLFMRSVTQLKNAGVPMLIPAVDTDGSIVAVCVRRRKDIFFSHGDLGRVTALFENRPWISPGLLSRGFRTYISMFIKGEREGDGFKARRFYSTKTISVSWFLKHLDSISKEIEGDYGGRFNRLRARK